MTASPQTPTALPLASGARIRAELSGLARAHRARIAAAVVLLLISAACGLVLPRALGGLVDLASGAPSATWLVGDSGIGRVVVVVTAALVVGAALDVAGTILSAGAADRVIARLRERAIGAALRRRQLEIESAGSGDVVSRSSDDVAAVTTAVNTGVPALVGAGTGIVVTVIGMATVHWSFAVALLLVTVPVYGLAARRYLREAPPMYRAERAERARRAGVVLGAVRGAETVRAHLLADVLRPRLAAPSWRVARLDVLVQIANTRLFGGVNLAEFLGVATLLVTGFTLVDAGVVTLGEATTAVLFFLRLFDPIGRLIMTLDQLHSAAASLSRIVGMIDDDHPGGPANDDDNDDNDSDDDNDADSPRATDAGSLRVHGLTAGYGARPVVVDIGFDVPAGATVALVGASGSGKSTIAGAVAGVREADAGTVTVGGLEVSALEGAERARVVALVAQEGFVFPGTVRSNLDLVSPGAGEAVLWSALGLVGLADWARGLPEQLDTELGPAGLEVSSVRAQQLALARVAVLDPLVIVLDEAASEASPQDAGVLDEAVDGVRRGRTTVMVAHRLDQARRADRILVVEEGRIVESGTHAGLLDSAGRYADLWDAATAGSAGGDRADYPRRS